MRSLLLFLGTTLVHFCRAEYIRLTSGTCSSNGYQDITTIAECQTALDTLSISKTVYQSGYYNEYYPSGCIVSNQYANAYVNVASTSYSTIYGYYQVCKVPVTSVVTYEEHTRKDCSSSGSSGHEYNYVGKVYLDACKQACDDATDCTAIAFATSTAGWRCLSSTLNVCSCYTCHHTNLANQDIPYHAYYSTYTRAEHNSNQCGAISDKNHFCASPPTYESMGAGYCLPDSMKYYHKTLDECKSLCTADASCDSFAWYSAQSHGGSQQCIISHNGCDDAGEFGVNIYSWERFRVAPVANKIYDYTKADNTCEGTSCDNSVASDVEACCSTVITITEGFCDENLDNAQCQQYKDETHGSSGYFKGLDYSDYWHSNGYSTTNHPPYCSTRGNNNGDTWYNKATHSTYACSSSYPCVCIQQPVTNEVVVTYEEHTQKDCSSDGSSGVHYNYVGMISLDACKQACDDATDCNGIAYATSTASGRCTNSNLDVCKCYTCHHDNLANSVNYISYHPYYSTHIRTEQEVSTSTCFDCEIGDICTSMWGRMKSGSAFSNPVGTLMNPKRVAENIFVVGELHGSWFKMVTFDRDFNLLKSKYISSSTVNSLDALTVTKYNSASNQQRGDWVPCDGNSDYCAGDFSCTTDDNQNQCGGISDKNNFCGANKIYDYTKADTTCEGTSCDNSVASDVEACCSAVITITEGFCTDELNENLDNTQCQQYKDETHGSSGVFKGEDYSDFYHSNGYYTTGHPPYCSTRGNNNGDTWYNKATHSTYACTSSYPCVCLDTFSSCNTDQVVENKMCLSSDSSDLSTGQPARGSSVLDRSIDGSLPGKANDGATNNVYNAWSSNHWHSDAYSTCDVFKADAWWGVELKTAAQHFTVTVYSRNCCNDNGSEDFDVLVSNDFPNDRTGFSSFTGTTALCGEVIGMGDSDVVTIACAMDQSYKYVILRPKHCKDNPNQDHYFHLPEVVVNENAERATLAGCRAECLSRDASATHYMLFRTATGHHQCRCCTVADGPLHADDDGSYMLYRVCDGGTAAPELVIPTCVTPDDTAGYVVTERSMVISHFQVSVSCASGFSGAPAASVCSGDGESYSLSGCTDECTVPSYVANAYVNFVTTSLVQGSFQVTAECAENYASSSLSSTGGPQFVACDVPAEPYEILYPCERCDPGCDGVCFSGIVEDCHGVCGGTAVVDCAGTCGGSLQVDCEGVCGGTSQLAPRIELSANDEGYSVPTSLQCSAASEIDCNGYASSHMPTEFHSSEDVNGVCCMNKDIDCAGICDGEATEKPLDYESMGAGFCLPDSEKYTHKTLDECKALCTAAVVVTYKAHASHFCSSNSYVSSSTNLEACKQACDNSATCAGILFGRCSRPNVYGPYDYNDCFCYTCHSTSLSSSTYSYYTTYIRSEASCDSFAWSSGSQQCIISTNGCDDAGEIGNNYEWERFRPYVPCCLPAEEDCFGTCGGDASTDTDGTCCYDSDRDCTNICHGTKALDSEQTCCETSMISTDNVCCVAVNASLDKDGTCCLDAEKDCANVCNGAAVVGCDGVCDSGATLDPNDVCCYSYDPSSSSLTKDCEGFCGGTKVFDCAGVCDGTMVEDCAGTCGGNKKIDCRTGACTFPWYPYLELFDKNGECCFTNKDAVSNKVASWIFEQKGAEAPPGEYESMGAGYCTMTNYRYDYTTLDGCKSYCDDLDSCDSFSWRNAQHISEQECILSTNGCDQLRNGYYPEYGVNEEPWERFRKLEFPIRILGCDNVCGSNFREVRHYTAPHTWDDDLMCCAEEDIKERANGGDETCCISGSGIVDCANKCVFPTTHSSLNSSLDQYGTCCLPAQRDCTGKCHGSAVVDCAGTCEGSAVYDTYYGDTGVGECCVPSARDCAGTCFGSLTVDCAGVCGGNSRVDCDGRCGGDELPKGCDNQCYSDKTNGTNGGCCLDSEKDCEGVCFGAKTFSPCVDTPISTSHLFPTIWGSRYTYASCVGLVQLTGSFNQRECHETCKSLYSDSDKYVYAGDRYYRNCGCCPDPDAGYFADDIFFGFSKTYLMCSHGFDDCCEDSSRDCANTCDGSRSEDTEGTCCLPEEQGCDDICHSGFELDTEGVCCLATLDCAGVCEGTHIVVEGACCSPDRVDSAGSCCPTDLDESGICCEDAVKDECGSCTGIELKACACSAFTDENSTCVADDNTNAALPAVPIAADSFEIRQCDRTSSCNVCEAGCLDDDECTGYLQCLDLFMLNNYLPIHVDAFDTIYPNPDTMFLRVNDGSCNYNGLQNLETLEECKAVVEELTGYKIVQEISDPTYPKGCSMTQFNYDAKFNTAESSVDYRDQDSFVHRPVCKYGETFSSIYSYGCHSRVGTTNRFNSFCVDPLLKSAPVSLAQCDADKMLCDGSCAETSQEQSDDVKAFLSSRYQFEYKRQQYELQSAVAVWDSSGPCAVDGHCVTSENSGNKACTFTALQDGTLEFSEWTVSGAQSNVRLQGYTGTQNGYEYTYAKTIPPEWSATDPHLFKAGQTVAWNPDFYSETGHFKICLNSNAFSFRVLQQRDSARDQSQEAFVSSLFDLRYNGCPSLRDASEECKIYQPKDVCGVCGGKNIKLPGEMYEWNGPGGRLFDKLMQADSYYYGNGVYTLETVYDQHGECCSKFLSMPDVVHDPWFAPIYTGEGWHTQKTIFNLVGRIYDEANDICCEPEDMDCEGVCFGSATLDCHRTCNGNREWVLEFPDRLDKESIWKRHKNHVAHKGSAFLNEVFESIQEEVYDFSKQKMVQPYMHIANRTFVTKLLTAESFVKNGYGKPCNEVDDTWHDITTPELCKLALIHLDYTIGDVDVDIAETYEKHENKDCSFDWESFNYIGNYIGKGISLDACKQACDDAENTCTAIAYAPSIGDCRTCHTDLAIEDITDSTSWLTTTHTYTRRMYPYCQYIGATGQGKFSRSSTPFWESGGVCVKERRQCIRVTVGPSTGFSSKTVTNVNLNGYTCPSRVDGSNTLYSYRGPDTFEISQEDDQVTATRTDFNSGWDLNLRFECCLSDPLPDSFCCAEDERACDGRCVHERHDTSSDVYSGVRHVSKEHPQSTQCCAIENFDCNGECNGANTFRAQYMECCRSEDENCEGRCSSVHYDGTRQIFNLSGGNYVEKTVNPSDYRQDRTGLSCCHPEEINCDNLCPTYYTIHYPYDPLYSTFINTDKNGVCCFDYDKVNTNTKLGSIDSSKDCAGICNGASDYGAEGVCCLPDEKDCLNVCHGTAEIECDGTCRMPTWEESMAIDVHGTCCLKLTTDCAKVCNGVSTVDSDDVCCLPEEKDLCGMCFGSNACLDCAGVPNGDHVLGIAQGCCLPEEKDCAGECFGPHSYDSFETCCTPDQKDGCDMCFGSTTCGGGSHTFEQTYSIITEGFCPGGGSSDIYDEDECRAAAANLGLEYGIDRGIFDGLYGGPSGCIYMPYAHPAAMIGVVIKQNPGAATTGVNVLCKHTNCANTPPYLCDTDHCCREPCNKDKIYQCDAVFDDTYCSTNSCKKDDFEACCLPPEDSYAFVGDYGNTIEEFTPINMTSCAQFKTEPLNYTECRLLFKNLIKSRYNTQYNDQILNSMRGLSTVVPRLPFQEELYAVSDPNMPPGCVLFGSGGDNGNIMKYNFAMNSTCDDESPGTCICKGLGSDLCFKDCAGFCGGTLVEDCAGVCGGNNTFSGCDNSCGSTLVDDKCGICGGDGTSCDDSPVVTIQGSDIIMDESPKFKDPGATCSDTEDGIIDVVVRSTVLPRKAGNYTVEYTCTDSVGQSSTASRRVTVNKFVPPPLPTFAGLDETKTFAQNFQALVQSSKGSADETERQEAEQAKKEFYKSVRDQHVVEETASVEVKNEKRREIRHAFRAVAKQIREEVTEQLKEQGLSKKEIIQETRVEVSKDDMSENGKNLLENINLKKAEEGVAEVEVFVAVEEKRTDHGCDISTQDCCSVDWKDDAENNALTLIEPHEDDGSIVVGCYAGIPKCMQKRVGDRYNMSLWNVELNDFENEVTVDVDTLFRCKEHTMLIGSLGEICGATTCDIGEICTDNIDQICETVACPNTAIGPPCRCEDGYTSTLVWNSTSYAWEGGCEVAECPFYSSGVPCACVEGYDSTLEWVNNTYVGECTVATCPDHAQGTPCTCNFGYSGVLEWVNNSYVGNCTRNPAVPVSDDCEAFSADDDPINFINYQCCNTVC